MRKRLVAVHGAAGVLALLILSIFWFSTVVVELFGDAGAIAAVKDAIMKGVVALVLAIAVAGASGAALARGTTGGLAARKMRRMPFIAANGLLILVPSAIFLAFRASEGHLDTTFAAVQGVELLAGMVNAVLIGLNLRDGLRLKRHRSRRSGNA